MTRSGARSLALFAALLLAACRSAETRRAPAPEPPAAPVVESEPAEDPRDVREEARDAEARDARGEGPRELRAKPSDLAERPDEPRRESGGQPASENTMATPPAELAAAPGPSPPSSSGPAVSMPRASGVSLHVYAAGEPMSRLGRPVPGQTPNVSRVVPCVDLDGERGDFGELPGSQEGRFVAHASGWLEIPVTGTWGFELASDDGARFQLDGRERIANDGEHPALGVQAEAELASGLHPFEIWHFENEGRAVLRLLWRPPGTSAFELVPPSAFTCTADEEHVTSPGPKQIVQPLARGSPGDGQPLAGVHPSFELARVRPEAFEAEVGGMDWLPDGRLALCTPDADGSVFLLAGVQGDDPGAVTVQRIAAGLADPLGLRVVDGRIFVLQKQELTELVDRDGDGITDEYRAVCSGWSVAPDAGELALGLAHRDGTFFLGLASSISPGGAEAHAQAGERGSVLAVSLADPSYRVVAHGLCLPDGIGAGPQGELYLTDRGDGLPASKLVRLQEGAFYGSPAALGEAAASLPLALPVAWFPHGEIGGSPSEPVVIPSGPYRGQILVGDAGGGGIQRVFVEEVDGVAQGAVFRFTQGLADGVRRLSWGPDGALYVGGAGVHRGSEIASDGGATGSESSAGGRRAGLERLEPNGRSCFEPLAVRALANGLELEFTEPLASGSGWEPDAYAVRSWRCEPSASSGSLEPDLRSHAVRTASVSADRRRVFLELDDLERARVVHVRLVGAIEAESGRTPWTTEAWLTLQRIPEGRIGVRSPPPPSRHNTLTDAELQLGWQILFDGTSARGWRGFRQSGLPSDWVVEDGELVRAGTGGDLVTAAEYEDFELSLEWKVAPGGSSGICFRVAEDGERAGESGPEMQVLDSELHPEGQDPRTSAGASFALYAPPSDASRPVGLYNQARLVVQGARVEHWLNGRKILEYELGSPEWEARVAASRFAAFPGYGRQRKGRIALQAGDARVWYRDIKIRPLSPP